MIEVRKIWDDIKKAGLEEYVSTHERWINKEDFKRYQNAGVIVEGINADKIFYVFLSLFFIIIVASVIFIFQGKVIYGIVILLITILHMQEFYFKRYMSHTYLLKEGILNGILFKKIIRKFKVRFTVIYYRNISEISAAESNKLIYLNIKAKDGKSWPYYRNYREIPLPKNKAKTQKIIEHLVKISEEYGIPFIHLPNSRE